MDTRASGIRLPAGRGLLVAGLLFFLAGSQVLGQAPGGPVTVVREEMELATGRALAQYLLSGPDGVDLARTGQTRSFAAGDDGNLQAGVAWPSSRFTDHGDGTLTDNLTGLMWLKDGGCLGMQTWDDALAQVASINSTPASSGCADHTASYPDWRLPNLLELESLLDLQEASHAGWLLGQGFTGVQEAYYWSSTTYRADSSLGWVVDLLSGAFSPTGKSNPFAVWAVRAGSSGLPDPGYSANVWKTGQTTSYASGDDGALQSGVSWPAPRLVANSDGTVTDNLTGLMWLQDVDCLGGFSWTQLLGRIATLSQSPASLACQDYTGSYTDWRLPNRKEQVSLLDVTQQFYSWPIGSPFVNGGWVNSYRFWTSSSEPGGSPWYVSTDMYYDSGAAPGFGVYGYSALAVRGGGATCSYSLSPASAAFGSTGGSGSAALTASAPSCGWTVTRSAAWITITSSTSNNGNGPVTYTVAANPSSLPRTGTITAAGRTLTVTQAAAPCTFSLTLAGQTFGAAGGLASLRVTPSPGDCTWAATSDSPWIAITAGTGGTGAGTVSYSVEANPGSSSRSGSLTIEGQTFAVTQAAYGIVADLWTPKAPLPAVRSNLGAAELGGLIYAAGGGTGSGAATVEAYDPATNQWTARASMSMGRSGLGVAAAGDKVYALSGWDGNGGLINTPTVEAYDPDTNAWSPRASMLTGRRAFAVAVANGKIYAFGGCDAACNALSAVEEYDPATDAWTAKAPLPTPRRGAAAAAVNGKIYVIGGCPASCSSLTTVEEYDPATDTWASRAPMPTPRSFLGAVALGGRIYALGGFTGTNGTSLATAEVYDPVTNAWSSAAPLITPRRSFGAAVAGSRIYAIGGLTGSALSQLASVEEYTPYPTLSIGGATMSEGDAGTGPATFTATLSEASSATVAVQAATANGTATAGEDYDTASTTLTFPPGSTSQPFAVAVHGDTTVEPGETFSVQLSNPSQALLGDPQTAAGLILNDDCSWSISPESASFGAAGGTEAVTVTAPEGCAWTAAGDDPWILVTPGASGSGNGVADYSVEANTGVFPRTGTLTVAGQTVTVQQAAAGLDFHTVIPCRVLDTRSGSPLASGVAIAFPVAGSCGIPATAKAAVVNATAVSPTGNGYLTLFPGGMSPPTTSTVNFQAGRNRANNAVLALAPDGAGTLGARAFVAASGQVHMVLDVTGYFE